jgi:ATP-binding cassette subfamily B protein/subfamily B ATP-binding cassette protein MsbA
MKNFLRVVQLTLRRRWTFAAAVACSIGVALLWGANLALIKPVIEVVFAGQSPHALVHAKLAAVEREQAELKEQWAAAQAALAASPPSQRLEQERRVAFLAQRLATQERLVAAARRTHDLVLRWLPDHTLAALMGFLVLFLTATLLKDALLVGNLVLVERLTQRAMLDLRNRMFRRTLVMEMAHFGEGHSSHLLHRINSDVHCVFAGVNVLCGRFILEPLKMLAFLVGAAWICWKLLLISLLVAPPAAYVLVRLTRSLRKANKRAMEEMGQLYTLLTETLTNIQTVKAYGMERFERQRYHQRGKRYFHRAMRIVFFNALGRASTEFLGMTIICVAIGVGAYLMFHPEATLWGVRLMDRELSLGSLMTFYALLAAMSDPARKMSEVMGTLQRGIAAADRIYEILDARPAIVDPPAPVMLSSRRPELLLDHVSFQYRTGQRVLHDIHLRIPFGETVAIVGPNGCGKTSLVSLLPRFYDPVSGAVRLEGVDIRQLRLKDLRQRIGLVAQHAALFDDTVLNNIRYGSPHATEAQVIAAAEKAHAHRFILERLEHGYQTVVGERGGRLSGGQRQRILLARAILRDPQFLILDEATSQIDPESEQLIHRALEQFIRGRTTLLITHRMSLLALADRIVVMDMGRIVDCGTHDELLARCPLYARLQRVEFQQAA